MEQTHEFLVINPQKVGRFIENKIGVDFEITLIDGNISKGSIVVFDLLAKEHELIRKFISKNNLWIE